MIPAPPVYLDECVDAALVEALRKRGFSLTCAADENMAGRGIDDETQLAYATAHGWVLATYDVRDFYRLARGPFSEDRTWQHDERLPSHASRGLCGGVSMGVY